MQAQSRSRSPQQAARVKYAWAGWAGWRRVLGSEALSMLAWCWEGMQGVLRYRLHVPLPETAQDSNLLRHTSGSSQCALPCILLCTALYRVCTSSGTRTCSSRSFLCRACSPLRRTASGAELSELSPDELESIHRGCNSLSDTPQPVRAQA